MLTFNWLEPEPDQQTGSGPLWTRHTTICPRSSDSIYIVSYYMKWATTSWSDGMLDVCDIIVCDYTQFGRNILSFKSMADEF